METGIEELPQQQRSAYQRPATHLTGRIGSFWGSAGVCLLLAFAVVRLFGIALESLSFEFHWYHWLVLVGNILFMAYSEGYKGFQRGYAPRVAARARHLLHSPKPLHVMLAPLFCMGYFHTTKRRLISAYALTMGIMVLVFIFHHLGQPWRGILDAGVVVGLIWGICSLVWFYLKAMNPGPFDYSAEIPASSSSD